MRPSVIFTMLCAACGPAAVDHFGNGTDGGNGGGGGGGGGGGSGSNCASTSVTAQVSPLDIFIMLDQSGSMADSNKWTNVTAALDTFLSQSNLQGFSAGIGYFGNDTSGFGEDSCTASDYATPAVEIAALPGASTALKNSIAQHSPVSGTPTYAALGGAISHAKTWATAHPNDVTAIVFATDGVPEECDTNQTHINALASAAYAGTPKIATFVIGVGSELTSLNGLAAAGGTTAAFLVDTGGNTNQQFLDAMNAIRNSAACTYQIPLPTDGSMVDYQTVNVVVTPNGGSATTVPQVANQAACPATGDGWYYDNPAAPTTINLCATSCGSVQTTGTNVDITLGCDTVIE
ncbi:MAG: vWA domain-containing protein [Kofleriaceae bacterium]